MPETTSLTLTNARIAQLSADLSALDGLRKSSTDFEPFMFNPELMWTIAENQTIIDEKLKPFERAKKALAAQYKITERMAITPENSAQVNAFMEGLSVLQETEVVVDGLKKISRGKLNVGHDKKKDQNQIPQTVLARLMVILEE